MSTHIHVSTRRLRLVLGLVGGGVFTIGLLTIVAPRLGAALSLDPLVALLGNDFVLIASFGVLALLSLGAVLVSRGVTGLNQASPPAPEDVHRVPYYGEPFDDFVTSGGLSGWVTDDRHEEVRTRLRQAAISTVMREASCTRTEARRRVDAGTWTNDAEIATFLTESGTPGLRARLEASLRGESPFQRAARTTAVEIASRDPEVAAE